MKERWLLIENRFSSATAEDFVMMPYIYTQKYSCMKRRGEQCHLSQMASHLPYRHLKHRLIPPRPKTIFNASLREGGGPRSGGRSPRVQKQRTDHCRGRIWNPPLRKRRNIIPQVFPCPLAANITAQLPLPYRAKKQQRSGGILLFVATALALQTENNCNRKEHRHVKRRPGNAGKAHSGRA